MHKSNVNEASLSLRTQCSFTVLKFKKESTYTVLYKAGRHFDIIMGWHVMNIMSHWLALEDTKEFRFTKMNVHVTD